MFLPKTQTGKHSTSLSINKSMWLTVMRNADPESDPGSIILCEAENVEPWIQEICATLIFDDAIFVRDFWMPASKLARAIYSVFKMDGHSPSGSVEWFVDKFFPKELRTEDYDNFLLAE
jgi:hypothetical protein